MAPRFRARVLAIVVALGVAGCDRSELTTLAVLGVPRPDDWAREDCRTEAASSTLEILRDPYWSCWLPARDVSVRVNWWLSRAVAGSRTWSFDDRARWRGVRDSIVRAMDGRATREWCPPMSGSDESERIVALHWRGPDVARHHLWAEWIDAPDGSGSGSLWLETGEEDRPGCAPPYVTLP